MTRSTLYRALVVATVATVPLFGCRNDRNLTGKDLSHEPTQAELDLKKQYGEEIAAPTAVGGGPVDVQTAFERIVEARCAREATCGFVGADRKWASHDACIDVVSREYADDLKASECPGGVDGKELNECLTEARNADCANAIDVIGRVAACRKSDMCRNQ